MRTKPEPQCRRDRLFVGSELSRISDQRRRLTRAQRRLRVRSTELSRHPLLLRARASAHKKSAALLVPRDLEPNRALVHRGVSADRCKEVFCGAEPRSVRAWRDHLDHVCRHAR